MSRGPLLLTRDFGLVWGQMISQVGDGVSKLALWFVYSITGVPLKTTIIGLLQTVPPFLFGPQLTHTTRDNYIVSTARDLAEGIRFVFKDQRMILHLMLMAALYTFGASAFATLFPVFGRKMLDLGPVEVGYLWSALAIPASVDRIEETCTANA